MLILWVDQNKSLFFFGPNLEHHDSFANWATNKYTCRQMQPTLQCYRINYLIFSYSITKTLHAWFRIFYNAIKGPRNVYKS